MTAPPNIILCTCDQLRAFEVGCYGNPAIQTPHLDRLASQGIRFETAVTNFPVCMAARSILLSGQYNRTCTGGVTNIAYPGRPGDFNMPEYPEMGRPHLKNPTLPERLRAEGYRTAAIGKWHIHSWPQDIGFDDYVIPRVHHCHTGQGFTENGGPEFVPDGYSVDFESERVQSFLARQRDSARPFFLYYNISVPHCPLADAPESFRAMYAPDDVPLRPNVDIDRPLRDQEYWFKVYRYDFRYYHLHLPYTETLPAGYSLRHLIAEYYGMTTWMDTAVGRMLAALDRLALTENTLVIFTSDHGDNLGSLGLVQKGGANEESIRIPLILRWPAGNLPAAVNRTHVASLVDVAPTLLSLIGAPIPPHFHGRDLAPLCRGQSSALPRPAIIEMRRSVAIRAPGHLYVLPYGEGNQTLASKPTQFFDLAEDPFQLQNRAGENPLPDPVPELDRRLRQWDADTPWMAAPA